MAFCCAGYLLCWCEVVQSWWVSASRGLYCLGISGSCLWSWEGLLTMPFFMSQSACLSANVPLRIFLLVCFVVGVCSRVGEHNPLVVCHIQVDQFNTRPMWALCVCVCVLNLQYGCKLFSADGWKVPSWGGLVRVLPNGAFHSPPIHVTAWWRRRGSRGLRGQR